MAAPQVKPLAAPAAAVVESEEEAEIEPEEEVEETALPSTPEPVGATQIVQGAAPAAIPSGSPGDAVAQPAGQPQPVAPRAGPAPLLFGHSGSRKNKKHKRRH